MKRTEVEAVLFRAQEPRSLSIHSFLVFRILHEPLKCAPLLPREFWYDICFSQSMNQDRLNLYLNTVLGQASLCEFVCYFQVFQVIRNFLFLAHIFLCIVWMLTRVLPDMIQVKRKKGGNQDLTEDSNVNVTLKHANRKSCQRSRIATTDIKTTFFGFFHSICCNEAENAFCFSCRSFNTQQFRPESRAPPPTPPLPINTSFHFG